MTLAYNVSPLRRLIEDRGFVLIMPEGSGEPARVVSTTAPQPSRQAALLAWREQFNRKHIGALGEPVTWDEDSSFSQSEDYANRGDSLLRYVTAVFAYDGDEADLTIPSDDYATVQGVLSAVYEAPVLPKFKQIIGCWDFWLPAQADFLVEDDNWCGFPQTFGSSYRLLDELRDVETLIVKANPAMTSDSKRYSRPGDSVLDYAWRTCRVLSEFCAVAVEQRLPMFINGR